jgi:surface protein
MPQGIEFDGSARDDYTINSYNSAQWSVMEAAGAVFFPSAGKRVSRWYGTNRIAVDIYNPEKIGAYWTSTPSTTDGWAYLLYIDSWSWPKTYEQGRSSGYSVRLVQDHAQKTEVYTEFVESTGTLTYYYDNKRDERKGVTEVYNPIKTPDALRFNDYNHKIVKAVIDPSMKNAPLTSTNGMFYGGTNTETFSVKTLYKMTTIEGLGNLNTAIMTDMQSMFFSCSALTMLDLSSFNTSKVTSMNGMFLGCNKLEVVDISSFDISNVTDLYMMFSGCSKLKTIYCSNDWSTSSARSDYMFSVCNSLVGGKGTVFDGKVIDNTYARPDGGTDAPGYFTADTMTRINSLTPALSKGEGAIYNLSGQRVNKPVQKGLYIINGKKMMVK